MSEEDNENSDIFRKPPVRYLGYANEVGEAFRSQVHVNVVRLSYVVASSYVVADALHKGYKASEVPWQTEEKKKTKVKWAVIDTLIWQGLASVIIPGFTINRTCFLSNLVLKKQSSIPAPTRKWITTFIGLACIPFIIKPIDLSVDVFMEKTFRKYYHYEGHIMKTIVRHNREDP
ncbi:mitochondrial fission process protein 1-like [Ruditapes philippinarum]|uniref:mitochondrial fission process protein 1-like n=1 Tax=Ruditapes philippinarum TaxID=129788 RepID=UPI00295A72EC|nr:mitochondrial fission process protein 1-like [Ruditapes philippinarum]